MNQKQKWLQTMMERLDTDEAGVRAFFAEKAAKSKRNPTGKGGFGELDKSLHKELSRKGGRATKKTTHQATTRSTGA